MSYDVGEVMLGLKNKAEPPHSSFSNPSDASPASHLILQPFRCFTYVTGTSRTSPGEPPMHRGMKKTVCAGLACYSKLLSLEVATVLDSC